MCRSAMTSHVAAERSVVIGVRCGVTVGFTTDVAIQTPNARHAETVLIA
jgi:hypothetical protein